MKIYSALSFALILILLCGNLFASSKDSTQIISVNVDIVAKEESNVLRNPKVDFNEYFMIITLINEQDSIVHFSIMTCGWGENFTTNNNSFTVDGNQNCDSNYPITIEIKSHKSIKFFTRLRTKNSEKDTAQNFKIGFIDFHYNFWSIPHHTDKKNFKIYWSDNIKLEPQLNKYKIEQ